MPQVTNRRLVGDVTGCPVGRGTVYNAMLKVSSTNRERAAKVNSSENRRLDKVTRVINKDVRYTEWKAGKEIDRTKNSLRQLAAFQKVLREDFSAKDFSGPISNRATTKYSGPTSNVSNSPQLKQKVQSQIPASDTKDSKTNSDALDLAKSKRVQWDENCQSSNSSVKKDSLKSQSVDEYYKYMAEKANKILGYKSSIDITKKLARREEKKQNEIEKSEVKFRLTPDVESGSQGNSLLVFEGDNSQNVTTYSKNSSENVDEAEGFNTEKERGKDQHKVESELERRRRERKERTTKRIYTHGFGMKTLHWEVERKMRLMNPERVRKNIKKNLLDESKDTVERNRCTFDKNIMKGKQDEKDEEPRNEDHLSSEALTQGKENDGLRLLLESPANKTESHDEGVDGERTDNETTKAQKEQNSFVNPLLHKIPLF